MNSSTFELLELESVEETESTIKLKLQNEEVEYTLVKILSTTQDGIGEVFLAERGDCHVVIKRVTIQALNSKMTDRMRDWSYCQQISCPI